MSSETTTVTETTTKRNFMTHRILFQYLIDTCVAYGQVVRSVGHDGLKAWQDLSKHLDKIILESDGVIAWKVGRIANDGSKLESLGSTYTYVHVSLDVHGEQTDQPYSEEHHFLLQMVRIPRNKPCSVKTILQIAYNIGQWQAVCEMSPSSYTADMMSFVQKNNLDDMDNHVDVNQVADLIKDEKDILGPAIRFMSDFLEDICG